MEGCTLEFKVRSDDSIIFIYDKTPKRIASINIYRDVYRVDPIELDNFIYCVMNNLKSDEILTFWSEDGYSHIIILYMPPEVEFCMNHNCVNTMKIHLALNEQICNMLCQIDALEIPTGKVHYTATKFTTYAQVNSKLD